MTQLTPEVPQPEDHVHKEWTRRHIFQDNLSSCTTGLLCTFPTLRSDVLLAAADLRLREYLLKFKDDENFPYWNSNEGWKNLDGLVVSEFMRIHSLDKLRSTTDEDLELWRKYYADLTSKVQSLGQTHTHRQIEQVYEEVYREHYPTDAMQIRAELLTEGELTRTGGFHTFLKDFSYLDPDQAADYDPTVRSTDMSELVDGLFDSHRFNEVILESTQRENTLFIIDPEDSDILQAYRNSFASVLEVPVNLTIGNPTADGGRSYTGKLYSALGVEDPVTMNSIIDELVRYAGEIYIPQHNEMVRRHLNRSNDK